VFGLLADAPGSGKTYVAICLAMQDTYGQSPHRRRTLFVVPHHVYSQWLEAIEALAGARVNGTSDADSGSSGSGAGRRRSPGVCWSAISSYVDVMSLYHGTSETSDFLLTTCLLFDAVADALAKVGAKIYRVVFDEIDSLVRFIRRPIPSERVWFVSASVDRLFGADGSLLVGPYNLTPASLRDSLCKCDTEFVRTSFEMEDPEMIRVTCLRQLIDDVLLEACQTAAHVELLHSLDYKGLLRILSPMQDTSEWNTPATPEDALRSLLNDRDEELRLKMQVALLKTSRCSSCFGCVSTCVCDRESSPEPEVERERATLPDTPAPACPIPIDNVIDDTNPCDDSKHARSTDMPISLASYYYKSSACDRSDSIYPRSRIPTCDRVISVASRVSICPLPDPPSLPQIKRGPADKKGALHLVVQGILARQPRATVRVLVFSRYQGELENVSECFEGAGLVTESLDSGNVDALNQTLSRFFAYEVQVLLCDLEFRASGLNLQMSTDVVLLHTPSDASTEMQAIGRAQRPGRLSRLRVWRILHDSEDPRENVW
jgi:hypothetical protein